MPVAYDSITHAGGASWVYEWSGTGPYRLDLDGVTIEDSTTVETYAVQGDDTEEPPALEVTDLGATSDDPQNERHRPKAVLQWRGSVEAEYYTIEQYVAAAWTTIGQVLEEGLGYYTWVTDALDDGEYLYRITAIDARSYSSAALPYTFTMVRCADAPSISMGYAVGTGLVTVEAR